MDLCDPSVPLGSDEHMPHNQTFSVALLATEALCLFDPGCIGEASRRNTVGGVSCGPQVSCSCRCLADSLSTPHIYPPSAVSLLRRWWRESPVMTRWVSSFTRIRTWTILLARFVAAGARTCLLTYTSHQTP